MLRSRFIFLLAVSCASLAACAAPTAPMRCSRFRVRRDVRYTPQGWPAGQWADFYIPSSEKPAPAVLLIHGGGWNGKESRHHMAGIARELAMRGYFVMNATYRLTPDWKFPAQTEDLKQAVRHLRGNAHELNIDPARIATFGYSAGGHLAALVGLDPENRVKAIVAGGAPTDLSFWPDGRLTGLLLGGPVEGNEAIYRAASPVHFVRKDSPPVFIYHGTADDLVPMEHAKVFASALAAKGVSHETYWIEGRSHIMSHLFPSAAIREAIAFLDRNV